MKWQKSMENNYREQGFLWNMLGTVATAVSSVMLLVLVKRFAGMEAGADYAIAVAVVNVLMNVGHLNSLGYQIADVTEKFSFSVYLRLRKMTVLAMTALSLIYVLIQGYPVEKGTVICLYCIYKAISVFGDVYQGRYQQKGRMDLAGRLQFLKVFLPDAVLGVCICWLSNVPGALLVAIPVEAVCIWGFNCRHFAEYRERKAVKAKQCVRLLVQCMPLFFSAFSIAYILNSSKYAIDKLLDARMQVYYSVLLLPATTVHMIAGIIYRPMITEYAVIWEKKDINVFLQCVRRITLIILTAICVVEILSGLVIMPILEVLYGISDLHDYQNEFRVILLAGGLNAVNTFLSYLLTIMKRQNHMYWIYGITFVTALFLPNVLIRNFGFQGAAFSFLILVVLQTVFMYGVYRTRMKQVTNSKERESIK